MYHTQKQPIYTRKTPNKYGDIETQTLSRSQIIPILWHMGRLKNTNGNAIPPKLWRNISHKDIIRCLNDLS